MPNLLRTPNPQTSREATRSIPAGQVTQTRIAFRLYRISKVPSHRYKFVTNDEFGQSLSGGLFGSGEAPSRLCQDSRKRINSSTSEVGID